MSSGEAASAPGQMLEERTAGDADCAPSGWGGPYLAHPGSTGV